MRTVHVTVRGEIGSSYALEATSDFASWIRVDQQANTSGTVVLSESPTTNATRFYRAVSTSASSTSKLISTTKP